MSIKPLNPHYSMENPASIYDEEALTTLELAGRTTAKVNEVVEAQNALAVNVNNKMAEVDKKLADQDKELARQISEEIPTALSGYQVKTFSSYQFLNGEAENIDLYGKITEGYIIDSSGVVVQPGQTSGYFITDAVAVTPLYPYRVTCSAYQHCYCYAFFDDSGAFISGYKATASNFTALNNHVVFAPENAATIRLCRHENNPEMQLHRLTIDGQTAHSAGSVLGETIMTMLDSLTAGGVNVMETAPVSFGVIPDHILQETGRVWYQQSEGEYYVTELIRVDPLSIYQLKNVGGNFGEWDNYSYLFYDISHNVIGGMVATNGAEKQVRDFQIVTPANACYIQLAYYVSKGVPTVEKVTRIGANADTWGHMKWCAFGDSLTEANHRTTKNYHDFIHEKTGIQVVNMGISGTGYMRNYGGNNAFYQRISAIPDDTNVVTIFGSGNDLSQPLGNPTDTGTSTVCGCINTTIDNLYTTHPGVILGIVAPTPWNNNTPADNSTMARYCEALETICRTRGVPYLDLFHNSGMRPNDPAFLELTYSNDDGNGVHPNEFGHKMIAGHVFNFLQSLIGGF